MLHVLASILGKVPASRTVLRIVLVVGLFVLLVVIPRTCDAQSNPEKPLAKVTLQLKWRHHFQFAGYYAAIEKGFYREAGLEVALVEGRPGMDFVDEVISGQADFGVEMPGLLIDRSKGKPVVALAAIFQHSPLILVMRKDSGIQTPQDLRGRTVAIRFGSDAELLAMFVNEGVPLDGIKLSELSWDLDDLIDNKVDAIHGYLTNEPFSLQEKGVPYTIIRPLTYGIDFYGDCLFTSEQQIRDHPQRVKAFRNASLRGWAYAMKHPEEIVDLILAKYDPPFSRESMLFEAKVIRELMLPNLVQIGHMNPGRWRHIRDTFVKLNMMGPDYNLDDFLYDPDPQPDYTWARWVFGSLGAIVALIGVWVIVLFTFNRRLHRAVVARTQDLSRANEELGGEISERKRAEEALEERTQQLDGLLSNVDAIILEGDPYSLYYVGGKVEEILGYPRAQWFEDSEGPLGFWKKHLHPDDAEEAAVFCGQAIARGEDHSMEYRMIAADGSEKHFYDAVTVETESGAPTKIRSVMIDITERKRAEEELAKHRKHLEDLVGERTVQLDARVVEAEELNIAMVKVMEDLRHSNVELAATSRDLKATNKELDAFSYSVSHDLRAPLRHIDGFVKLLVQREKDHLDPTSSHYLETIAESSAKMGRLIDELLAFSRTGRAKAHLERVDSNEVVREAREVLSTLTEDRRVTWKVGDLPAVQADRGLLRLVWENLIANAIKYTGPQEEACIEIDVTREGVVEGSGEIAFFVRDNGVGFDPQYTHKLFGVFQRLHRDDEFEGTGIGLATVRRIVHRHGGRVWAEGKVGCGATFYFTLKQAIGEE